jgi:hypothetical protein
MSSIKVLYVSPIWGHVILLSALTFNLSLGHCSAPCFITSRTTCTDNVCSGCCSKRALKKANTYETRIKLLWKTIDTRRIEVKKC